MMAIQSYSSSLVQSKQSSEYSIDNWVFIAQNASNIMLLKSLTKARVKLGDPLRAWRAQKMADSRVYMSDL